MKIEAISGVCPDCGQNTPTSHPSCIRCGLWQSWGDNALVLNRAKRRRDYIESEAQLERDWENLRCDQQGRAPRPGVLYRMRRALHLFSLHPGRVAAATLGAVGFLMVSAQAVRNTLPQRTPHPRTVATGRCVDGTWTYARNRSGACSGHGGVKVFYR